MKNLIVVITALILSGCNITYTTVDSRRGLAPQSQSLIDATTSVGASPTSPVLIRIFKESNELELWRKNNKGHYVLVNTFTVCTFSGDLGPKIREGDRQAPEGFYNITTGQLNYQSIRFLSLNTGFPNAYDRSHNATGSSLMIHGGCDSAGCYAIEDAPMQDLFAAVRDAIKHGQKSVQLHIFPFRMNSLNMFFHRNNKHYNFWQQLKLGYDRFEETRQDINVSVVNRQYVIR
jgi:murein L,D-transpeptidase YafK